MLDIFTLLTTTKVQEELNQLRPEGESLLAHHDDEEETALSEAGDVVNSALEAVEGATASLFDGVVTAVAGVGSMLEVDLTLPEAPLKAEK